MLNRKKISGAFIVLIILILGGRGVYDSLKYSSQLSPIADPFSEANALRAGEGYSENGFLSNAGLPDLCYGDQFPGNGAWRVEDFPVQFSMSSLKADCVYTHYPPGPDLLAGLFTKICGVGNLGCFRLFPTAFGIFSLALFAWMLSSAIGPVKSAIMMLAIAVVPMASNMMHGLHYHSYAFSLLLIQLGLLLKIFRKRDELKPMHLFIFFLIGFFQGWLSFDHFFLVSLCALPFALLYSRFDQSGDRKRLLLAVLVPTIGFGLAHFIHFIQVCIYYNGSVSAAFNDIFGAALWRFDDSGSSMDFITGRIILAFRYLVVFARQKTYFVINFPVLLGLVFIFVWVKNARLITHRPLRMVLKWRSSGRNFYVILTALLVAFLWIIVMKQHAAAHTHFLPRHLFLLYFVCILTMLECLNPDNTDDQKTVNQADGT